MNVDEIYWGLDKLLDDFQKQIEATEEQIQDSVEEEDGYTDIDDASYPCVTGLTK